MRSLVVMLFALAACSSSASIDLAMDVERALGVPPFEYTFAARSINNVECVCFFDEESSVLQGDQPFECGASTYRSPVSVPHDRGVAVFKAANGVEIQSYRRLGASTALTIQYEGCQRASRVLVRQTFLANGMPAGVDIRDADILED